jgi:serine/threonine protein kinase
MLVYEDGGKPLIEALKDPSLNMDMLYKGLWRLFFGLYVIHNNDLYHLDIKSDNVLVQITPDEYTIKYIDFGIMKTSEEVLKTTLTLNRYRRINRPKLLLYMKL